MLDFCYQRGKYTNAPRPHLILLDLNLPRKTGTAVIEEIRADPDLRPIPVIILSDSDAQEGILNSYNLTANAYLTKPLDPDEFISNIKLIERFWLTVARLPH